MMTFWELVAAVALGSALGYGMAVGAAGIIAILARLGHRFLDGWLREEPGRFCIRCNAAVGQFDAHFCNGGKR